MFGRALEMEERVFFCTKDKLGGFQCPKDGLVWFVRTLPVDCCGHQNNGGSHVGLWPPEKILLVPFLGL